VKQHGTRVMKSMVFYCLLARFLVWNRMWTLRLSAFRKSFSNSLAEVLQQSSFGAQKLEMHASTSLNQHTPNMQNRMVRMISDMISQEEGLHIQTPEFQCILANGATFPKHVLPRNNMFLCFC
jgi:hypothetical protein